MSLGEKLKQLRNERKITQIELAKILNVSQSTIKMIESNLRNPSHDLLLKIAEYFDVPAGYFLGDDMPAIEKAEKESIIDMLLKRLIEEGIIKDAEYIDETTANLIMAAVRQEVKRIKSAKK